jgi:MoaA/NifB/PqqE/SkfB family radical SAM enzyme
MKEGGLPIPLQVQLIISDLCNHNCNFCAYRLENYTSNQLFGVEDPETHIVNNNPNRMIPVEKVYEILEDCADMGVKAMQFTGGGEPTVHPHHDEIFARTVELGMDLALVTNGARMTDKAIAALVKGGKWVRVSIDAGDPNTYKEVREVSDKMFDRVWRNIAKLAAARNAAEETDLLIGLGFVVTPDNWKEVYSFVERAVESGADNVRISAMFSNEEGTHDPYAEECSKLLREVHKDFGKKIKVFDMFSDRLDDLAEKSPDYSHCPYMKLNVYIGGDQNIYSCCNNAYNLIGLMGTIKDKTFKEFWFSEENIKKYTSFNAKKCARCMFNNKNRFINYMLLDDPQHVNYV